MKCTVEQLTFDAAAVVWDGIVAQRTSPTVFDSLVWQRTWWERFGTGAALKLMLVRDEGGKPVLLAPFMQRGGVVSFLGGTDLVDYHDLLSPDGPAAGHVAALMDALARDRACGVLEFLSMPQPSPAVDLLASECQKCGWTVDVAQEDVAPRMDLPATWEEYIESLSKKDRHELRRKMRRIEGAGQLRDVELKSGQEVAGGFDDFLALHRKSMPEKAEFMTPERESFFREVSAALAAGGTTRLRFLELDGKRVAASLSFVVRGVRYLYNSGYDPEYRELAVGLMNHAYGIKASIAEGLSVFDFMRGNEPYKYHLGGQDRVICRIIARR